MSLFKPYLALSASAGSGKTFALSVRYISLLFLGESPSNILTATFTNKAAAEMRSRILKYLRNLKSEDAFKEELSKQTGLSEKEILDRSKEVLNIFLSSPNHIVTIDGFILSVLRSSALEIGLEPDFDILESANDDISIEFLKELDSEGLLSVLVELAIEMQKRQVSNINSAMRDWYKQDTLLPEFPDDVNISEIEKEIDTLREDLYQRVESVGASNRAIKNFEPLDINQFIAKTIFKKDTLYEHRDYKKYLDKDPQIEIGFQRIKSLIRDWMRAREARVLHRLGDLYSHYKNTRIFNSKYEKRLSFDDILFFAYRLLYESISKEFLYFKLDSRFKHILLDEFQDTSTLQFLLLKPLIDEIFAGEGQGEFRSLFYVGDTKQSLYRFRGGVESLFDKVAQNYSIPIENLEYNYRSCYAIVNEVNRCFEGVMPNYIPQKPYKKKEGYFEVIEESKDLLESSISAVKYLLAQGIKSEEIAILVFTNGDGLEVQNRCFENGIPTILETTSSLKNLAFISSLVSALEYLYRGNSIFARAIEERSTKSFPEDGFKWWNPDMKTIDALHNLIEYFGYFSDDPNILKLMEFASKYPQIHKFLDEFSKSRLSVASQTIRGVKILTIHGSKGLEFPYVVLMDKLKGENSDKEPIMPLYRDDLHIEKFFYRIRNRDIFDNEYREFLKMRKEESEKDRLNLLYVALTRAVDGIIIVKKDEKSAFSKLDLSPVKIGVIEKKSINNSGIDDNSKDIYRVKITPYGKQELPKAEEDEEREEGEDFEAILFGTALHYTLEMLGDFDLYYLPSAIDAMRNRYGVNLGIAKIEEIEKRVANLLRCKEFLDLLEGGNISKEQTISYRNGIYQIDLLIDKNGEITIVDYKSSKKFISKHKHQVYRYIKAFKAMGYKRVRGVLLYILDDGVELLYL